MPSYTPVFRCALVREGSAKTRPQLDSTAKAREACNNYSADSPCEQMLCVLLDVKHRVIGISPITVGVLDASLVHPREFFRPAILSNAAAVIMAHNHPSGDMTPSREDWAVFERLRNAGDVLGINVLDSIIVDGCGNSLSMCETRCR